jgi:hypothetical protein
MRKALCCLAVSVTLAACGGGSGSTTAPPVQPPVQPPAPTVKVTSGDVVRYVAQPTSIALDVVVQPNFTPTGTFYARASDKFGVIKEPVTVTPNQDGSYTLSVNTLSGVTAGHYTGDLTFKLCADQACAMSQPVASVSVPFDITVLTFGSTWPGNLKALTPWTGVPDWSTFQGNPGHTGYVPVELNPNQFSPRWKSAPISASQPSSYGYWATLSAANGLFYSASDNVLKARKEHDGSVVWTYDVSALQNPSVNPPAVGDGVVYMAAGQQSSTYMFGLDAASGELRFKSPMSSQWENYLAPVAYNGSVYTNAGTYGGLYGFSSNGDRLFFVSSLQQMSMWSPAVDATAVYAYTGDSLSVIEPKTGVVLNTIKDPAFDNYMYQVNGSPVLGSSGAVFAANYINAIVNSGSMGNELLKFNAIKGTIEWRIAGNFPVTPAYRDGVLYAVNTNPYRLEARAEADGALVWSWLPQGAGETDWIAEPVVTKNLLFVGTNSTTYAIDLRTRKAVWTYPASGKLALTQNGVLYIQNAAELVAVNVK